MKKVRIFNKITDCVLNVLIVLFALFLLASIYSFIQVKILKNDHSSLFGYSLPRTTTGLIHVGHAVSESNMQPGDIIVWTNQSNGAATHVGIYIGGNQMVHAANYRLGVVVSDLDYWKGGGRNRIISIRRV